MKRKLIIQIHSLISSGCGEIIDLTSPGSSQIIEMTSYNTDLLCTWLIKVKLTSIPQLQIRSLARIQKLCIYTFYLCDFFLKTPTDTTIKATVESLDLPYSTNNNCYHFLIFKDYLIGEPGKQYVIYHTAHTREQGCLYTNILKVLT